MLSRKVNFCRSFEMNAIRLMQQRNIADGIVSNIQNRNFSNKNEHPNVEKNTAITLSDYPPRKNNWFFNFGSQGYAYVIERFGKFNRIANPGLFIALPIIERMYQVDTRMLVIDVNRQNAYTTDNVAVSVAAQLYLTIVDIEKACYKVEAPLVAVMSQAQSALRTSIGKYDLDHLLSDRNIINNSVREALSNSIEQWGINVSRFEITELTPDKKIQLAMDLQSTAERERRAAVTVAEGKQKAMILEAEGKKLAMELEAEGMKNMASSMQNISSELLSYNIALNHIKMVKELAVNGNHTNYFVPKDISAFPAIVDMLQKESSK
jgi:regulator of protease activity HflC (stomatin/prohibitin superfamily)